MIESAFNQLFRSKFGTEIHQTRRDDSKSQSEFEVVFEFGPRKVKCDRKVLKL